MTALPTAPEGNGSAHGVTMVPLYALENEALESEAPMEEAFAVEEEDSDCGSESTSSDEHDKVDEDDAVDTRFRKAEEGRLAGVGDSGNVWHGSSHAVVDVAGKLVRLHKALLPLDWEQRARGASDGVPRFSVAELLGCDVLLTEPAPPSVLWLVVLFRSGHFAAMIVDVGPGRSDTRVPAPLHRQASVGSRVCQHRTAHRYTTRRKQGGAQSKRDSSGRRPKSMGAQIRRRQEEMLAADVASTWSEWSEDIARCTRVYVSAAKPNYGTLFPDGGPLVRADKRIRRLPVLTGRPTYDAVKRAVVELCSVETLGSRADVLLLLRRRQRQKQQEEDRREAGRSATGTASPPTAAGSGGAAVSDAFHAESVSASPSSTTASSSGKRAKERRRRARQRHRRRGQRQGNSDGNVDVEGSSTGEDGDTERRKESSSSSRPTEEDALVARERARQRSRLLQWSRQWGVPVETLMRAVDCRRESSGEADVAERMETLAFLAESEVSAVDMFLALGWEAASALATMDLGPEAAEWQTLLDAVEADEAGSE